MHIDIITSGSKNFLTEINLKVVLFTPFGRSGFQIKNSQLKVIRQENSLEVGGRPRSLLQASCLVL